jgi:hypothetical protein
MAKNIKKGVFIKCRKCGINYIEDMEWIMKDGISPCPNCQNELLLN